MTPEETAKFEEKIYAYVGRETGPPRKGKDNVNQAMIRHWTEVTGDNNPVYTDSKFARQSNKSDIIAPPTMLQIWSMEGYTKTQSSVEDAQRQLHQLFDNHGFTGVLGTNSTTEFNRDLKLGDEIATHTMIDCISEQKATARGIGYFIDTVTTFTDQSGGCVGRQTFRVLKFIPNASNKAFDIANNDCEQNETFALPTRIPPVCGFDNQWWWKAIDEGRVLIQRCRHCHTLRHPPRPMCGECQSIEWDCIESALQGEVFSFTTIHYPKVPGYQYPLCCAVIALNEGTRIVANVVGIDHTEVTIGMKVKGSVETVDNKTRLPQFYPI